MKTKTFRCPNCGHKQKFRHVITGGTISQWKCPDCSSPIKIDAAVSIPTSLALVFGLIIILNWVDPPIWGGLLIAVGYAALALIVYYKTVRLL
jgi:DNA-directed RNA polymerase subunit RPC12/RpoP